MTGWRSPALAPVYALTTAFVVVLGIGLLAPKPTLMVRMDAVGEGATVQVLDASGALVEEGPLPTPGTYELPDMDDKSKVCVRLPEPWRVMEPAGDCTTGKIDTDIRVAVVRDGRVRVVFEGGPAGSAKVSLQDNSSVESVEVTGPGPVYYKPRGSLAGQRVCVEPLRSWIVRNSNMVVERDGTWCTPAAVADAHNDFDVLLADRSVR